MLTFKALETLRNNHQVLASIEISRYTYFRTHGGGNFAVGIVFEFALYVQNIVLTFSDRRETAYWQALKARFEPPGMQVLRVANGRTRQKLIAFEDPRFFSLLGAVVTVGNTESLPAASPQGFILFWSILIPGALGVCQ